MRVAGETRADSWVGVHPSSDFPLDNLPFGALTWRTEPLLGIAIGERVVNLTGLARTGCFDGICAAELLARPTLNELFGAGRDVVRAVRTRVAELLRVDGDRMLRESAEIDTLLLDRSAVRMRLPVDVGDYVDFYSSLEHATNLGRIFRPDGEPLLPNWRWMPIGYHGRSATIVVDDTPIVRPFGQRRPVAGSAPSFEPSAMLDVELEVGFVTGSSNQLGQRIDVAHVAQHVAGLVLVNDWSARDVQAWEYQPLGPFLGKSFATTMSPWVVTLDALEPFRVAPPVQDPAPLPYLRCPTKSTYDIHLSIELQTQLMRERRIAAAIVSRTNYAGLYWTMAQQLAHATANGALIRPGDLFASGTISGSQPDSRGSFIELTWRGEKPLVLESGETRAFLEDGDEVTLRGWCERPGAARIGFGACRGRVVAAR